MNYYIHPTAVVETQNIGNNTYIGPFCYVSKRVILGENCNLLGHCSLGTPPQYKERPDDKGGIIKIDNNTEIREFVTINLPTQDLTYIGKNSLLMANVHVPHDAYLSDDSFLVVGAALGGFTCLGKGCYLGLNSCFHQYSKLGDYCLVGSNSFFKGESPSGIVWVGSPAIPIKVNIRAIDNYLKNNDKKKDIIDKAKEFIMNWSK